MVLRELVTTCHNIGQIQAQIRDDKMHLIDEIHIGTRCQADRHEEPRWKVINKPVNKKETDSEYWGTLTSNIPTSLLEKQVIQWQLWQGFSLNNGLWKFYELQVSLLGIDEYIESTGQIEGQMELEQFYEKEMI
jgi:hypothetical protein